MQFNLIKPSTLHMQVQYERALRRGCEAATDSATVIWDSKSSYEIIMIKGYNIYFIKKKHLLNMQNIALLNNFWSWINEEESKSLSKLLSVYVFAALSVEVG